MPRPFPSLVFLLPLAIIATLNREGAVAQETASLSANSPAPDGDSDRPRLRELGISIGVLPTGKENAITDVSGVSVGHLTCIEGDAIRTGVTAIKPHEGNVFLEKVPAAVHVANGFGKFVGTTQVNELGVLETPIVLTNTLSTFAAADALVGWTLAQPGCEAVRSVNPVVGECNDGYLNDIRLRTISANDVIAALDDAHSGSVAEGCVGAGTAVRCMGWKGGIGTSSRVLPAALGGYTVGVLVQTNFGGSLTVDGVPVGRALGKYYLKDAIKTQEHGSCIVIIATDAPLDARRLGRLARRAPLGLAAAGSPISHGSGDYVLAFSTAHELRASYETDQPLESATLLRDDQISPLFQAVRDATEEAVINSMLKAVTTTGYRGRTVEAIDPQSVVEACRQHGQDLVNRNDRRSDVGATLMSPRKTYGKAAPSKELIRRIERMESSLPGWMREFHVPGVSVALIEDRQLIWSRGYGRRCAGNEAPVAPETVMEACSMSKPFFAYMFLKLVEQGEFQLDRSLIAYLGADYLEDDIRHRDITASMVLSHTSGLPNWRPNGWRSGGPISLGFEPGTKFRYSGEGFLMLQRAVETQLGSGLDEMSRSRLIEPLGLSHTRFIWDERLMSEASCGHDKEGQLKNNRNYYESANAAFSLYTSAEDYARFVVEMLRTDRSGEYSVSAQGVAKMLTPFSYREDQNADWGLGWGLRRSEPGDDGISAPQVVYHSGSNGSGFRCYSEFQPQQGEGLVIMTNAVGGKQLWNAAIKQWHSN